MEKIKQALELARKQQKAEKNNDVHSHSNAQEPGTERKKEQQISYSQTKVISLDERHLEKQRILHKNSSIQLDAAYRMLRTQVLQKLVASDINSLAVTSSVAGQGKTLTAINLAISLAREVNYTVLLVDFDLKKPSLHRTLGFKPEVGISDYLFEDIPLHQILVNPGIEHLVLLPGRERIHNSSEMLKSKKMIELVDELKSRYPSRLIIFDIPPMLSTDDALAFSPFVESMLLVVEEGKTTKEHLSSCMNLLKDTNILGTVLNKSKEKQNYGYS